jgi:hypothetical protein
VSSKIELLKAVALFTVCLLAACGSTVSQKLTLDTRQVPAVVYLPDEIKTMMEDLGYVVVPESDTARLARSFDNYRLQLKARDAEHIRVDVDFRLADKITKMHLYNTNEKTPSAATRQRYQVLKARLQQEFGVDSVR